MGAVDPQNDYRRSNRASRDSTMEVMRPEKREKDPERWKSVGGADRGKTVYMQKARLCVGHTRHRNSSMHK